MPTATDIIRLARNNTTVQAFDSRFGTKGANGGTSYTYRQPVLITGSTEGWNWEVGDLCGDEPRAWGLCGEPEGRHGGDP